MKTADGEIPLPESIIQHIQSLMSGKEAARTTVLSKPWYNAWLTRPTLDLDDRDFHKSGGGEWWHAFEKFAEKTLRRYLESGLKIERFRLRTMHSDSALTNIVPVSIIIAMEIGATDVELQLPWMATFPLSHVLGSETLLRLSLIRCHIEGNYAISCSRLKSLKLQNVSFENADDVFNDIISCCINSIEELSLSYCSGLALSSTNLSELHKLRHLFLDHMEVDAMFFIGFATRFPCLKDLSIVECKGYTRVVIASNSLETIRFEPVDDGPKRGTFDVPNIRKFTYSGGSILPSLSVNGASREWEFDMSIACSRIYKPYWFMNLKRLLAKFRLSRIFLSISLGCGKSVHGVGIKAVPKPLTVERLMIDVSSSWCCGLLVRIFGICRPNFITHYWLAFECDRNGSIDILCKRSMQKLITPNSGIPDQDMFGKFGLKQVNMEVYEEIDTEWRPLVLEKPLDASLTPESRRKIQFELVWD